MDLLSLNDDVIYHIVYLLKPDTALACALTCRRLYPIAIPQVSAEARCQYPDAMARLHKFMLSDIPNRASRLRDLRIVVQRRKNLHEDKDSAALLVDLLENTTNLRRLSIGHFFYLPFDVSRVENAIAALSHLADIHLHGSSLKTLKAIVKPARNLRVLRLRGFGACRSDPFLTLLSVLPGHHQLRELHLNDLGDRVPSSGSLPWEQYPSVVTLTVTGRTPPIYALANAFPNVRSLCLSDVDINFASANGQCWQALRHFKASDVHDAAMWGIVCPVHHLELKEELDFYGDNLLKLISNVSPVMASLWCWDDMTMELWETIVKAAPRLRYLRLDITTSTTCLGDSLEKLMDRILGPFRIVPLVCLSIVFLAEHHGEFVGTDEGCIVDTLQKAALMVPSLTYLSLGLNNRARSRRPRCLWWRITRKGDECTWERISSWEAESVQEFLYNSDLDSITNIAEALPLLNN